ncbi:hypothetical protein D3C84_965570 [compost metagenome]
MIDGEHRESQTGNDDPGHKVRNVRNRLDDPLEQSADFVQHKRQYDRRREADYQLQHCYGERVANNFPELRCFKKHPEMHGTYPGTVSEPFEQVVLLERQQNAVHRSVVENEQKHDSRQNH